MITLGKLTEFLMLPFSRKSRSSLAAMTAQLSLFANSDYITLHLPYMDSTKDTVNAAALSKMKDGVPPSSWTGRLFRQPSDDPHADNAGHPPDILDDRFVHGAARIMCWPS